MGVTHKGPRGCHYLVFLLLLCPVSFASVFWVGHKDPYGLGRAPASVHVYFVLRITAIAKRALYFCSITDFQRLLLLVKVFACLPFSTCC